MNIPMTIEEFNARLHSDQDTLIAAISQLTAIEEPQQIVDDTIDSQARWYGWAAA